jgi:hypothetical protein
MGTNTNTDPAEAAADQCTPHHHPNATVPTRLPSHDYSTYAGCSHGIILHPMDMLSPLLLFKHVNVLL